MYLLISIYFMLCINYLIIATLGKFTHMNWVTALGGGGVPGAVPFTSGDFAAQRYGALISFVVFQTAGRFSHPKVAPFFGAVRDHRH